MELSCNYRVVVEATWPILPHYRPGKEGALYQKIYNDLLQW